MSITTKTGDKGMTSLYGGKRVRKDDPRIEACGIIDEVSSYLGLARSRFKNTAAKKLMRTIQADLHVLAAELACPSALRSQLPEKIGAQRIAGLERGIAEWEKSSCGRIKGFCFSGKDLVSSSLHVARARSRTLERRLTSLLRKHRIANKHTLTYLNRLSDLLYLLARLSPKAKR